MSVFRLPKRDPRRLEKETPTQRLFRYLLIALLFCAVIWAFWLNSQRQMERLHKRSAPPIDATGMLTDEQQQGLAAHAESFREVYGLNLRLVIRSEPFVSPYLLGREQTDTVLIALSPPNSQALVELPPLVAAALGRDFVAHLGREHFPPYFANGTWPEGLAAALNLLTERLDAAIAAPGPQKEYTP